MWVGSVGAVVVAVTRTVLLGSGHAPAGRSRPAHGAPRPGAAHVGRSKGPIVAGPAARWNVPASASPGDRPADRSGPGSTISPGLTTRPSTPGRAEGAEEGVPAAEVAPADVHRAHHHPAVGGGGLHHARSRSRSRSVPGGSYAPARSPCRTPALDRRPDGRRLGVASRARDGWRRRRHRKMPAFQATPSSWMQHARRCARSGFSMKRLEAVADQVAPHDRRQLRTQVAVLGRRPVRLRRRASRGRRGRRGSPARAPLGRREHGPEQALPSAGIRWSAGSTTMTSSSSRSIAAVARAMAAAVLRPVGSARTWSSGRPGASARACAWASALNRPSTITYRSRAASKAPSSGPSSRRIVRWKRLSPSASSGRNGLGRSGVLSGHSRVPPPPARITTYTARF